MTTNRSGALRVAGRLALLAAAWAALTFSGVLLLDRQTAALGARDGSGLLHGLFLNLFRLRAMPTTLMAPWFFEALGVATAGTVLVLGISYALDPTSHATKGLRWSFRTLPCLLGWAAIALACCLPWAYFEGAGVLVFPVGVAYAALPFVCVRAVIVARERPPAFWGPGWPGLSAIVFAILALFAAEALPGLAASGVEWLPLGAPWDWMLGLVAGLSAVVLSCMMTASVVMAWLGRWNVSRIRASLRLRRLLAPARVIGALELQSLWLMALLVVPLALWFAALLDFAGAHAERLEHTGALLAPWQHALVATTRFLTSWWWIGSIFTVPPVCWWLAWNARARAIHLAEPEGPMASA